MKDLMIFGLLIVLLLVAQFATAITVDEIIERYLRARGGKDKLDGVKSIYMEGVKAMMGDKMIVKIMKEQDKLSRTEIETDHFKSIVLITEKGAWTYSSDKSPGFTNVPEGVLAGYKIELDIAGPLLDYVEKGYKAELLGKEIVEDSSCYKIRLTHKQGKDMFFWIDTGTYLVYQSSGSAIGIDNNESYLLHKNYKDVDGIKFAHNFEPKNTRVNSNEVDGEITFDKIFVNPALDPKFYQPG